MTRRITTLEDFNNYVKRQLGFGVITVEISDEQLTDIFYDSLDLLQRYTYSEFIHKDYLEIDLIKGQTDYVLDESIVDVVDLMVSVSNNGVNKLFTPMNGMVTPDDIFAMTSSRSCGGMNLSNYSIAMQKLTEFENMFSNSKMTLDYLENQQTLRVIPTPAMDQKVMLEVYKTEDMLKTFNHQLIKQLAIAKSKILWGTILGKFTITLPGGGNVNGSEIKSDGQTELENTLLLIKSEGEPVGFFVG